MAIRQPSGTLVNGVGIFIKDPNASSGLFSSYQRIPGVGSITLPDEAAPQNDIVTLDGQVGAVGFAAVGTIVVPLPVAVQHPTHRFLHDRRRSGKAIQVQVRKVALPKIYLDSAATVATGALGAIEIAANVQAGVKNQVREGMIVAASATPASRVLDYDATAAAGDQNKFRIVVEVADTGASIKVAPDFQAAISTAVKLTVRQPGMEWKDIGCQVAQMGDGDFQSASVVAGNLVLRPNSELPISTVIAGTS